MPEVFLVRHAPTSWSGRRYCGRADPVLTRAGRVVAQRLAAHLEAVVPDGSRIISGPARRARQTADVIARALGAARIELDARWSEADVGSAEGLTFDQLEMVAPAVAIRLAAGEAEIDWPGGESAVALTERVTAAWDAICEQAIPTIVVSHAGPMRIAVALATNVPAREVPLPEPGAVVRLVARAYGLGSAAPMLRFRP